MASVSHLLHTPHTLPHPSGGAGALSPVPWQRVPLVPPRAAGVRSARLLAGHTFGHTAGLRPHQSPTVSGFNCVEDLLVAGPGVLELLKSRPQDSIPDFATSLCVLIFSAGGLSPHTPACSSMCVDCFTLQATLSSNALTLCSLSCPSALHGHSQWRLDLHTSAA